MICSRLVLFINQLAKRMNHITNGEVMLVFMLAIITVLLCDPFIKWLDVRLGRLISLN